MMDAIGRNKREVLGICIDCRRPSTLKQAGRPAVLIKAWEDVPVRDWMAEHLGIPFM